MWECGSGARECEQLSCLSCLLSRPPKKGWLAKEARARNPDIKIWSLAWGVPGWVNSTVIGDDWDDDYGPKTHYFSEDNILYQVQWLKCLRDRWSVDSDFIG